MSRRLVVGVGAAVALLAVIVVAMVADRSDDDSSRPVATSPAARAYSGVCTAASLARGGDREGARRAFFNESHEPLHELATAAAERDRGAAARLLEAKERVESDLTGASRSLADDLDSLAATTAAAMTASGETAPASCGRVER